MIKKINNIIKNLITLSRVSLSLPDTGNYPVVQIDYMGTSKNMYVIWPYGMGGMLPKDSLSVTFNLRGFPENKAGIGTYPKNRFKNMKDGETWFGNPTANILIYFKEDGTIEVGELGDTFRALIDERFINLFNAHTHPDPVSGVSGTPTVPLTPGNQETQVFKAS